MLSPGLEHCLFVIFSRELADGVQRIKRHDGDEFELMVDFTAQELNDSEVADMPVLDADEDFLFAQCFVSVRVLGGCPTAPNARDHWCFSPY